MQSQLTSNANTLYVILKSWKALDIGLKSDQTFKSFAGRQLVEHLVWTWQFSYSNHNFFQNLGAASIALEVECYMMQADEDGTICVHCWRSGQESLSVASDKNILRTGNNSSQS